MINIYIVTANDSFVVYDIYDRIGINNLSSPILDVVTKIRKEIINESKDFQLNNIDSQDIDLKQYKYNKDTFELLMIYYSLLKEDFVRRENISRYIKNNISMKFQFNINIDKLDITDDQQHKGRQWINDFIGSLDINLLNENIILTLESCRGALKISDGPDTHIIWHNLNQYLKENGFK